jgi:hypothetical protein
MSTSIRLKKSAVTSNAPTTGDIDYGELAINYADGKLYYKTASNTIDYFGSVGAGGTTLWTLNGSDIYYNSGNVGIGVTDPGEALEVDGNVEITGEFIGDLRGPVTFKAQASENLTLGDAVYISGVSGQTPTVAKADADDAAKMPAFGLVSATTTSGNPCTVVTFGEFIGYDTVNTSDSPTWTLGDTLYVSTVAGEITNVPPAGESALIQNIGKVQKIDASSGRIKVGGAGRSNATPNLNEGRLFVGNSSNRAVADDTVYVDIANSKVGIGTTSPSTKLHVQTATNGGIVVNDGTVNGIIYGSTTLTNSFAIGTTSNHPLILGTNNTFPQMTLATSGNVGIGTASPAEKLDVNGNVAVTGALSATGLVSTTAVGGSFSATGTSTSARSVRIGNTSGDVYFGVEGSSGGSFFTGASAYASVIYSNSNPIELIQAGTKVVSVTSTGLAVTGALGASGDITTTTGKFATIASGQSVGLQLDGYVDGGSFNNYILNNSPTATTYASLNFGRLTSTLYGFIRSNNTSTNLEIGTAGTARLTIDQSGNVGIGATTVAGVDSRLRVVGGSDVNSGISMGCSATDRPTLGFRVSDNSQRAKIELNDANGSGGDRLGLFAFSSGVMSEVMSLRGGGNVGIGTTAPAVTLDVNVVGGMARVGGSSGNNLFQTYTSSGSVGAGIWAGGQTRFYTTGDMTLSVGATLTTAAPTGYTDALTISSTGLAVTGSLSSTGKITSGGNIQVVAAGDLTWGGNYGAGIPVINGTNGVGFTFYPGGSTTGAVGVLNASGLVLTGALSATTTLQAKTGITNPPSSGALTGLSMGFDSNTEVSWIQSERNSLAETRSLLLNPNGGFVGVGTAGPLNTLQINTSVGASVPAAGSSGHVFAAGSSAFGLTGGALTNGNAYLQATRWDGTAINYNMLLNPNGGNVGVGTATPAAKLDVNGNTAITGTLSASNGTYNRFATTNSGDVVTSLVNKGGNNAYLTIASGTAADYVLEMATERTGAGTGNFYFGGNHTTNFVFRSNGYAGLGSWNSTGLFVTGSINARSGNVMAFWDSANADYAYINNTGNSSATQSISYYSAGSGSVSHQFKTYSGGVINALAITPAGNVGIGVTPTDTKLEVAGSITLYAASNQTGNSRIYSVVDASNGSSYQGALVFAPQFYDGSVFTNPERMRIRTNGNVGIGTASPATRLHVQTAGNGGIVVNDGTVNGIIYGSTTLTNSFAIGTTSNHPLIFGTNNSFPHMTIATSGNVGVGTATPAYQLQLSTDSAAKPSTNTWTIASDARIKTETGEYTKGLAAVLSLRPITYRYNGKAGMVDDGTEKISIIAQEAMSAFPECVGSYTTKLNEDDEEETEVYNWNGHALTFALVNSIKELTERLSQIEDRLSALENN